MKERRIKIIVSVMTICVIGLIALQIYWINNMIKVEEERFERSVSIALVNAAAKIEKQEAAKAVIGKITGGKNNAVVVVQNDSLPNKNIFNKHLPFQVMHFDSSNGGNFGYSITYSDSAPGKKKIEVFESHISTPSKKNFNYSWNSKTDTLIFKRNQLVQNVLTELVETNPAKKIEDRISIKQLDTLLQHEFRNNGINTEFYFAVNKIKADSLTLIKQGADTTMLRYSDLRTMLFPAEIFFNPNQLVVYFPNKRSYLFSSVAGMLGLSIGLIIVIVGIFYKTVQMLVRQKKITETKNDLINNITHEFRTPISTISIACEALNEPDLTKDSSAVGKYSSIIKEENERLRMMVDNLLNTAALETEHKLNGNNSYNLMFENVEIDEMINHAVGKFQETLKQRNGKIQTEGIPSGLIVNADKFHFTNIIGNFIDNAIKYNEHEPEIKIYLRHDSGKAIIGISDNGIGIAKENHNKIFDTFYRVPTGNIHNVRGNGIGLSYAKKIVEAHKGNIAVQSALGRGSLFKISIPISIENL